MDHKTLVEIAVPLGSILTVLVVIFLLGGNKRKRMAQRIGRVTRRQTVTQKNVDVLSLRKTKESGLPFIGELLLSFTKLSALQAKLERAGLAIAPDMYVGVCFGITIVVFAIIVLAHKPIILGILAGGILGIVAPYLVVLKKGSDRIKKFLTLFPDAIEFIVRGLRSGLPVTESMNMVGGEMEEPIGSIFAGMGESVRLGVPVEKALTDTAKKLGTTEFNFFVTSIIMQRETGGNLSEILGNLADVLRKRFMMRMKIKAMSSEAKASAIIVGSLPFVVIVALTLVSPGYLDVLVDDPRGNVACAIGLGMLSAGIGIMMKMARFEI